MRLLVSALRRWSNSTTKIRPLPQNDRRVNAELDGNDDTVGNSGVPPRPTTNTTRFDTNNIILHSVHESIDDQPHNSRPVRTASVHTSVSRNSDDFGNVSLLQNEDRLSQWLRMIKLLAAVVLPSVAAVALGIIYMSAAIGNLIKINRIAEQIVISNKFGLLVTALQKERGSSTIYVSAVNVRAGNISMLAMMAARASVDEQLNSIDSEKHWRWTLEDPTCMQTKPIFVAALHDHRQYTVTATPPNRTSSLSQIDWYTNINFKFLAWVTRGFQDFLVVPVVNYKLILTCKDSIGIVRALGGTYYTQGGFAAEQYSRFIKAYTNGEALLQQATDLSSDLLQVYGKKRTEHADLVARLDTWQKPILANNSSLSPNATMGQIWFTSMTTYIDQVIAAVEATTVQQTEIVVAADRQRSTAQLVVAIVLVAPVLLLGPLLIAWYLYEVRKINRQIMLFAENVAAKSKLLAKEKRKSESLLYQMIPKAVADSLKRGQIVKAQLYDSVTIMFSDIVHFTDIAALCTPMEVVDLLNKLYTEFDSAIELHDVYKVETIGDAYMCVSGLPSANGDRHAEEIANLALRLLEVSAGLKFEVLRGRRILLRVGAHTGSVVAGVVGTKMPRYCLFGDAVNTASRMESTAEALTIQVSEDCAAVLRGSFGNDFYLAPRGAPVAVKGKGLMKTFLVLSSRRGGRYVVDVEEARRITQENVVISEKIGNLKVVKDIYDETSTYADS